MGKSSGGGGTTTTTSDPWSGLQPYLTGALQNAATTFGLDSNGSGSISTSPLGTPYSGPVNAPDSWQTTLGLGMRTGQALGNNGNATAANNYSQDVLNGKYLDPSTNPYLASTARQANQQITDSYNNNINPGIDSAASSAGRYGSGAYAALRNQSDKSLGTALSNSTDNIYNNAYNTGIAQQQNALALAPQTTNNNYTASNQLASTGDYYTQLGQNQLNQNIANYNTLQQQPLTALQTYSNLINGFGSPGGTSSSTSTGNRQASNSLAQYGGLGLGIAQLAFGSDINLKENIKHMGEENGHQVYEFSYKNEPEARYIGVMAQDVQKTHPEAVIETPKGLAVYYDKIGVKFRRV